MRNSKSRLFSTTSIAILACLLSTSYLYPSTPLELPSEVKGEVGSYIKIPAKTEGKEVRWVGLDTGLQVFPVELLKDSKTAIVSATKPGRYRVLAYTAGKEGELSDPAICIVIIGDAPPDPGPSPKPPIPPDPPKPPSPIAEPGFRVLIVYETGELSKLTEQQRNVIYSQGVRTYLDSKCIAGPDGKTKEWRIYDKDIAMSGESKIWQGAMERVKKDSKFKTPWILISTGTTGYEGPLPEDANSTIELLKKYAP